MLIRSVVERVVVTALRRRAASAGDAQCDDERAEAATRDDKTKLSTHSSKVQRKSLRKLRTERRKLGRVTKVC